MPFGWSRPRDLVPYVSTSGACQKSGGFATLSYCYYLCLFHLVLYVGLAAGPLAVEDGRVVIAQLWSLIKILSWNNNIITWLTSILKYRKNMSNLGVIFMDSDPDFPYRIRIFWPIRIRTQEKSLNQIRTKEPGSETLLLSIRNNATDAVGTFCSVC